MSDEEDSSEEDPSNIEALASKSPRKSQDSSLNRIQNNGVLKSSNGKIENTLASDTGPFKSNANVNSHEGDPHVDAESQEKITSNEFERTSQKILHSRVKEDEESLRMVQDELRSKDPSKKGDHPRNGRKVSIDRIELPEKATSNLKKSNSNLKPRSRDRRPNQRRFHEMIGKRELRNEELVKRQGDLRERLDVLECSLPAVMVWNIWRMAQGAPVSSIQRAIEKQFRGHASGEIYCPSTPSRHYDCRVREIEAERKQAQRKAEEARLLWTEKTTELETKKRQLEEAKKIQEERKERIKQLKEETQKLREALQTIETEGVCEAGECGDIECKRRWLSKVSSSSSIKSTDLDCLDKLQQLAEAEVTMKKQIAELERREDAYMRTLQQADELWSKVEGDTASTLSGLQEQLEAKTAANQRLADRICQLEDELEKLRTRLTSCRQELEKFMSVERIEAAIGRDDDLAAVSDKAAAVRVKTEHRTIGGEDDVADVDVKDVLAKDVMKDEGTFAKVKEDLVDQETLASIKEDVVDQETLASIKEDLVDQETLASIKEEIADAEILATTELREVEIDVTVSTDDKIVSVMPTVVDTAVDRPIDLIHVDHVQLGIHPEDFTYEEQKLKEAQDYLALLGSLDELDEDDDYICPPDFICNDEVFTETGMDDEELAALGLTNEMIKLQRIRDHEDKSRKIDVQEISVKKGEDKIEEIKIRVHDIRDEEILRVEGPLDEKLSVPPVDYRGITETAPREETDFEDAPGKTADVSAVVSEYEESAKSIRVDKKITEDAASKIDDVSVAVSEYEESAKSVRVDEKITEDAAGKIDDVSVAVSEYEESAKSVRVDKKITEDAASKIDDVSVAVSEYEESAKSVRVDEKIAEDDTRKIDDVSVAVSEYEESAKSVRVDEKIAEDGTRKIDDVPVAVSEYEESAKSVRVDEKIEKDAARKIDDVPVAVSEYEESAKSVRVDEKIEKDAARKIDDVPVAVSEYEKSVKSIPIDENNVVLSRDELSSWLNTVNSIRSTIAKCPECRELKPSADSLAKKIAAHIGMDVAKIEDKDLPIIREPVVKETSKTEEASTAKDVPMKIVKDTAESVPAKRPDDEEFLALSEPSTKTGSEKKEVLLDEVTESKVEDVEIKTPAKLQPDVVTDVKIIKEVEKRTDEKEGIPEYVQESIAVSAPLETADDKISMIKPVPREAGDEIESATERQVTPQEFFAEKDEEITLKDQEEIPVEILKEEDSVEDEVKEILVEKAESDKKTFVEDEETETKVSRIEMPEKSETEVTPADQETLTQVDGVEPSISKVREAPERDEKEKVTDATLIEEKVDEIEATLDVESKEAKEPRRLEADEEMLPFEDGEIEQEIKTREIDVEEMVEELKIEGEVLPAVREEAELIEEEKVSRKTAEEIEEKDVISAKEEEKEEVLEKEALIAKEGESIEVEKFEVEDVIEKAAKPMEGYPGLIDPQVVAKPYLAIADIEEKVEEPAYPSEIPCLCKPVIRPSEVPVEVIKKIEVTQTEIVQTETFEILAETTSTTGTQTLPFQRTVRHIEPVKLITMTRAIDQQPDVSIPFISWRKRHRDQSTVTTVTSSSQTEKSTVSRHMPKEDKGKYVAVPISDILQRAVRTDETPKFDREREIRSINYSPRTEQTEKIECNCCLCGKKASPTHHPLKIRPGEQHPSHIPQIFQKIAPSKAAKINQQYERLCLDCKIKRLEQGYTSAQDQSMKLMKKIINKSIHEREICTLNGKGKISDVFLKKIPEKRDQCCMAKIRKPKIDLHESRKKGDIEMGGKVVQGEREKISLSKEKETDKDSLTDCICYEVVATDETGPRKVFNCMCGDSD